MSEQHPLAETLIVRGPFEDWRHGKYQALPSTHDMIDWLRRMANLIEHEYVHKADIRAPIDEVIVGLNEWDAIKHGDADCRVNKLAKLAELANGLPDDLVADWRFTNHYELTSAHDDGYFWLCIDDDASFVSSTIEGQRLGLLLDIAAEVSRLKREGVL